jgi:hypothetical protein
MRIRFFSLAEGADSSACHTDEARLPSETVNSFERDAKELLLCKGIPLHRFAGQGLNQTSEADTTKYWEIRIYTDFANRKPPS